MKIGKSLNPSFDSTSFSECLARHAAPGKGNVIPRAPGYGRINRWRGALDDELIDSEDTIAALCPKPVRASKLLVTPARFERATFPLGGTTSLH